MKKILPLVEKELEDIVESESVQNLSQQNDPADYESAEKLENKTVKTVISPTSLLPTFQVVHI